MAQRKLGLRVCTWVSAIFPLLPGTPTDADNVIFAQIAKGLVVRSDERGYALVEKILGLFSDAELGSSAAAALGVIADDSDRVLSKENFAVIRVSCTVRLDSSTMKLNLLVIVRSCCTNNAFSRCCCPRLLQATKKLPRTCKRPI